MAAIKTLSIQDVSEIIDVSPRTIRKVLRATIEKDAQPGRGARWSIRESDIDALREKVAAYSSRTNVIADLSDSE